MLQIPEAVERMEYDVERVYQFLPQTLSSDLERRPRVDFAGVREELDDQDEDRDYDDRDDPEVLVRPVFSDLGVGLGPLGRLLDRLVVLHRFFVLTVAVKRFTDLDVRDLVVVVALQDLGPVVDRLVVLSVVVVLESVQKQIAVLGPSVNDEAVVLLVEQEDLGILIDDTGRFRDVADLISEVSEREQQVTVVVVCEHLGALLVDDRPRSLGTDGRVDYDGRALDLGGRGGGDADLAGRRVEAVALHDVLAGGVQLLDRSVVVIRRSGFDRRLLHRRVDRGRRYVEEPVLIDLDVVQLFGGDLGALFSLLLRLESSHDRLEDVHGVLLRSDEAGEHRVLVHDDDALVGRGGDDEESAEIVDRDGDRFVDRAFLEDRRLRFFNYFNVVAFRIEHDDTVVVRVADVDVLVVDEDAGGTRERVGYSVFVIERINNEVEFVVAVHYDDPGVRRVD